MYCKKCGNQIPDGSTFCPCCGASVSEEQDFSENGTTVLNNDGNSSYQNSFANSNDGNYYEVNRNNNSSAPQNVSKPKKKSKVGLIIGIAVICVIVIGAVVGVKQIQKTPINSGDYSNDYMDVISEIDEELEKTTDSEYVDDTFNDNLGGLDGSNYINKSLGLKISPLSDDWVLLTNDEIYNNYTGKGDIDLGQNTEVAMDSNGRVYILNEDDSFNLYVRSYVDAVMVNTKTKDTIEVRVSTGFEHISNAEFDEFDKELKKMLDESYSNSGNDRKYKAGQHKYYIHEYNVSKDEQNIVRNFEISNYNKDTIVSIITNISDSNKEFNIEKFLDNINE